MKIDTITVTQRKNLGNYEHLEISASAKVEDSEGPTLAMVLLRKYVTNALSINTSVDYSEVQDAVNEADTGPVTYDEETKTNLPVAEVKVKKEKKVKEVKIEAEVVKEEKVKPKKVAPYSSEVPEHKSILAGYLTKKYGDKWKKVAPVEEIKSFSTSLNGMPFLNDDGTVDPSFYEMLHTFFGV